MAICKYCGQETKDNQKYCTNCGAEQTPVNEYSRPQEPVANQNVPPVAQEQPAVQDNGGFGWGLLGCCIPLAGLILFLVWKDTKAKTAKAAGIGALVGFGLSLLLSILSTVLGFSAGMMGY